MKKILFAIVVCFGLATLVSSLVEGNNAFASNEVNASLAMDNKYCVGNFDFFEWYGGIYHRWNTLDVYEASNACGLYYALFDGKYYKLFPYNSNSYNYFFEHGGKKYYVSIPTE